jgi:hypothetical protein
MTNHNEIKTSKKIYILCCLVFNKRNGITVVAGETKDVVLKRRVEKKTCIYHNATTNSAR